jgi:CheY-like chemotaxis protein
VRALIADPDPERARRVGTACTAYGLVVDRATQGAEALERALKHPPDIVICPDSLDVIDGGRLAHILRANPRTQGVVFLYVLQDELDAPVGMNLRDRLLVEPWGEKELLEGLDEALERDNTVPEIRSEHEVEGNLSQISLLDLLQLFHLTRKTGTVRLLREGGVPGTVLVRDGEVIDATAPGGEGSAIHGAKALFRLMGLGEGRFEFLPGDPGNARRIDAPTRALLLEGARQIDEAARFRQQLPSPEFRVRLAKPLEQLPPAAHPLTREVLQAAEGASTVQEIVDRVPFPDYQVLRTLHALLLRGVVEAQASRVPQDSAPEGFSDGLLTVQQTRSVQEWAAAQRPPIAGPVRVPVVFSDEGALSALLDALSEFPGVRTPVAERDRPGLVHRVRPAAEILLDEPLSLCLVTLPSDERFRPVWSLAAHGMWGAVEVLSIPLSEASGRTEPVRSSLEVRGRPLVRLVVGGGPGDAAPDEDGDVIGVERPVVALPEKAGDERRAAVHALFARLVP